MTAEATECIFEHTLGLLVQSDRRWQRWPQRGGWNTRTTEQHLISGITLIRPLSFSFFASVITAISLCVMSPCSCSFLFLTTVLSVAVLFFLCPSPPPVVSFSPYHIVISDAKCPQVALFVRVRLSVYEALTIPVYIIITLSWRMMSYLTPAVFTFSGCQT